MTMCEKGRGCVWFRAAETAWDRETPARNGGIIP